MLSPDCLAANIYSHIKVVSFLLFTQTTNVTLVNRIQLIAELFVTSWRQ